MYFGFFPCKEPCLYPLFSLQRGDIVCASIKWRSWMWQVHQTHAFASLNPAVRPVRDGDEGTFMEIACRQVWWQMSFLQISKLAKHMMKNYEACGNLFETLWQVVQKTLRTSDEQTLELVHKRVARQVVPDASSALLDVDEALEVLESQDQLLIKQEQGTVTNELLEQKTFESHYGAMARKVHKPAAKNNRQPRAEAGVHRSPHGATRSKASDS